MKSSCFPCNQLFMTKIIKIMQNILFDPDSLHHLSIWNRKTLAQKVNTVTTVVLFAKFTGKHLCYSRFFNTAVLKQSNIYIPKYSAEYCYVSSMKL